MIKERDLTLKLPQGKTKRISDIYGLSAFLRGGKYKTTVLFQQRVTVKGKSHFITLKANTLKEARELAIKQYNDLHSVLYKGTAKTTLYEALCAYEEYYLTGNPKASSLKKMKSVLGMIREKTKHTEMHTATPEDIYRTYLKHYADEGKYTALKCYQSVLLNIYKLARAKDPTICDISLITTFYKIRSEEKHFKSLSYKEIGKLPRIPIIELSLYLLLRPVEMTLIKVENINLEDAVLTVPETKTMTDFIQPLSTHAVKLIKQIMESRKNKNSIYLFEGRSNGHLGSDYVVTYLSLHGFRNMQTAHAFRSMGRTWMEDNGIKYEVAEACLSHKVRDNTFRAYARTDYLNERRQAMQLWGDYVNQVLTGS